MSEEKEQKTEEPKKEEPKKEKLPVFKNVVKQDISAAQITEAPKQKPYKVQE